MPRVNDAIIGKRTPRKVLEAVGTIQEYLKLGGWVQAIINAEGGASFRLTDIHQDYLEMLQEQAKDESE